MGKKVKLTYNGLTLSKSEWCTHLGISIKAFDSRIRSYYPAEPDKVFSPYYLNRPEIKETMKEHQTRIQSDEEAREQARIDKNYRAIELKNLIARRNVLLRELGKIEKRIKENQEK